jgi:saccharopine dehydrogenase-like NADP-dependent oxidoreductase
MGAGKSSSALIGYLLLKAPLFQWHLTVIDANLANAKDKLGNSPYGTALSLKVEDKHERANAISNADIVISLLPPHLHSLVAEDCVALAKNLLTASYIDDKISSLSDEISRKKLLFLCEMGLDPGIDHMSAMQIVNNLKKKGGEITSFKSHCGGLVAPESDDNPWNYKISWNPRNVVMAGKQGANYKSENVIIKLNYLDLFINPQILQVNGHSPFFVLS